MRDRREKTGSASISRRRFVGGAAVTFGAIATGAGSFLMRPDWANAAAEPIKVGIATDLTGAIGYAGNANANTAKMLVKDLNAKGGLLGRPLELYIEDTASNESVAVTNVRKLIPLVAKRGKSDDDFGGDFGGDDFGGGDLGGGDDFGGDDFGEEMSGGGSCGCGGACSCNN